MEDHNKTDKTVQPIHNRETDKKPAHGEQTQGSHDVSNPQQGQTGNVQQPGQQKEREKKPA
jgi:hypothetical protein